MKTFNITTSGAISDTNSVAGSNVVFWTDYASKNTGFSATIPLVDCNFKPQGFKNIDLYSIEIQGTIVNLATSGGNFICNDYFLFATVFGNFPILGGIYGTGVPINLVQGGAPSNAYSFSKYNPKIEFKSPVQSFSQLSFGLLAIDGFVPTLIGLTQEISFFYSFDIFINYKFEGE